MIRIDNDDDGIVSQQKSAPPPTSGMAHNKIVIAD